MIAALLAAESAPPPVALAGGLATVLAAFVFVERSVWTPAI